MADLLGTAEPETLAIVASEPAAPPAPTFSWTRAGTARSRRGCRRLQRGAAPERAAGRVVPPTMPVGHSSARPVRRAERIRAGHNPFDAWFPYLGLGSPQFSQYQSLSHIVTGLLSIVFGDSVFRWIELPADRARGRSRCTSAPACSVSTGGRRRPPRSSRRCSSTSTGYGFEWGSFVWLGSGMWSMLWALWLMPIALGLAWRAVAKGERYRARGVRGRAHVRVPLHHRVPRAAGDRRVRARVPAPDSCKRLGRGALVGVGGLLIFAFVFVPTIGDLDYVRTSTRSSRARSGSTRTVRARSSPGSFRGEVFDFGRPRS